jgi:polyhydroxyalkanoate synthase
MMPPPHTLPLQILLTMMQSGSLPGGWNSWNANSWDFSNPFMPRPKNPLEQASELWKNLAQTSLQPSADLQKQLSEAWLSALSPQANQKQKSKNAKRATDVLPHFLQPEFLQALTEKATANSLGFMQGMQAYLTSDYQREEPKYRVLWKRGSARLLDLDPHNTDAVAVLMVPSLINKAYVLDLYPEASLAQHLKAQGFRPLILDWGTPGNDEQTFSASEYITAYALDALGALREAHDGPIALLGYCMGGIFTVAMAQLAQMYVDALILLATPWDFSAEDTPRVLLDPATHILLKQWIGSMNPVPPMVTQSVFNLINPWHVQEKYSRFPGLDAEGKRHFLAVEQWVNDGVPLVQQVAEECFVDWPHGNILSNHQWKVGRRWIEPNTITCPTLAVIPTKDAIVPVGVAEPLTREIPRCEVLKPESGHVSMVVGKNAKSVLWKPLVQWLNSKF